MSYIKTPDPEKILANDFRGFEGSQKYDVTHEGILYSYGRPPAGLLGNASYRDRIDGTLRSLGWKIHNGLICMLEADPNEAVKFAAFGAAYERVYFGIMDKLSVVDPIFKDPVTIEEIYEAEKMPAISLDYVLKEKIPLKVFLDEAIRNYKKSSKKKILSPETFVKIVYTEFEKGFKEKTEFENRQEINSMEKFYAFLENNGFISTDSLDNARTAE